MLDFKIKSAQQLSTLIEDVRKLQKLRQQDMAEKLHTTQQSYARMELNIGSSRVETLLDILQLLDVELVLRPQQQNISADQTTAKATVQATGKAPRKRLNVQLVTRPEPQAQRKQLEVKLVTRPAPQAQRKQLEVKLVTRPEPQAQRKQQEVKLVTRPEPQAQRKQQEVKLVTQPAAQAPRKRLEVELVLPPKQARNTEASRKKIKW